MDLKFKHIKWVGNIYQKFEAVCQDVDDIVGQDAVKYLENQVQNVGDSVKNLYSGVVNELLPPFHSLASSKYEDHHVVAETNNIKFSVESVACCKDNNKKRDEENPVNHYYVAEKDSNSIDTADNKQAGVPIKHILANQESDESCSCSVSSEVEDSYITQEEVGDDSRGTSGSKKENINTCIEEIAVESIPKPMNLMSVGKNESLEFSIHIESCSGSFDNGCEVSIRTKDSSLIVEDSYITQEEVGDDSRGTSGSKKENVNTSIEEIAVESIPKPMNLMSVGKNESLEFSTHSESCSDSFDNGCEVSIRTKDSSLVVEDSYITQEEVGDDSRGTSGSKKENVNTSIEEIAVESIPKPMNLISVGKNESLEFSTHSESCSGSFDNGCELSIRTKDSSLIVEENAMNSSSSQMLISQSLDDEIPKCLALHDSHEIDIADIQKASVHIRDILTNQVSDESCSVSLEVKDSYITQEGISDDSRGTSGSTKGNIHASIEEVAVESVPKPMNLMSVGEREPLEFPIHSEYCSNSFDSGCKVSIRTKDNGDVNAGQNSSSSGEEDAKNSSTSQVLSSQSLDEEESIQVSLFSESSAADQDTHGILAEVSSDLSVSSERPMTKTEPSCSSSSLTLGSLYSKFLGSYSFEKESGKSNQGDATMCISDSSMANLCCESSPHLAGQVMESQGGLVFCGFYQSMESKDKSLVSSIESCMETIQLNDDPKPEKSCLNVKDSELHAVANRTQKLRSYKRRITDAFSSKRRLSKEYEQLAIWYGDSDIELRQDFSQTLLPVSTRTDMESKNAQVQHDSETEWELL